MPFIGIDLGTTNSSVAAYEDGRVEVLTNDNGERITPSCVAYTDNGMEIGKAARLMRKDHPGNTIYGIKRIIGRRYCEESVSKDAQNWRFKVVNEGGMPKVQIQTRRRTEYLDPEMISAVILKAMKQIAEERDIGEIRNAVVTVPAYFNNAQRQATLKAAEVADLYVPKILNEPTAAAIAYAYKGKLQGKRTVLVYDLGGGTFDVNLISINGMKLDVIATGGDTHLGGDDFTNDMVDDLVKEFERKHPYAKGVRKNDQAMVRLFDACEEAKINLTPAESQRISIDALHEAVDFSVSFTRARFESLNKSIFDKTFNIVDAVLADGNMDKEKVDDVLLVGGSSRIPYIRRELEARFEGKIRRSVEPDEAVAYGAGVYAAYMSGENDEYLQDFKLNDVTHLSLGADLRGGVVGVIIKRNTRYPVKRKQRRQTVCDNQTAVRFNIYEGERVKCEDNHLLGGFTVYNVPPMPAGKAKLDIQFSIDENELLDVTAWETTTGTSGNIVINRDQRVNSDQDIKRMVAAGDRWKREDDEHRKKVLARNSIELKLLQMRTNDNTGMIYLPLENKRQEILEWLQDNEEAELQDLIAKQRELEAMEATIHF